MPKKTAKDILAMSPEERKKFSDMYEDFRFTAQFGIFSNNEETKDILTGLNDLTSDDEATVEKGLTKLENYLEWLAMNSPKFRNNNEYNGLMSNYKSDEKHLGQNKLNDYTKTIADITGIELNDQDILRFYTEGQDLTTVKKIKDRSKGITEPSKPMPEKPTRYLPRQERQALRDFNTQFELAGNGLDDKGFLGLRCSSDEHQALVRSYSDLHMMINSTINATDNKELAKQNLVRQMLRTREQMKGDAEKPSYAEFETDTEEIMSSPSFKETVQGYGGTSIGALNRIVDDAVKTGCKQFFGNFMQNLHHEKQREESFQKIKEDHAEMIQRQNSFEKTVDVAKTLNNT